ncbi:MAG: DAK2 domain-containing protein [Erysipelotrichaceae bacterium]
MEKINSIVFKEMLESAANNLTNNYEKIDALNVFPVPDGDTGTNMSLTFNAGVKEALNKQSTHVGELAKVLSKGLLMGARGNSGVILSQIFRGVAQSVEHLETLSAQDVAHAFVNGKVVAYKAVMRPVEGTILTVIREASDATLATFEANPEMSIQDVIDTLFHEACISLKNTPELLPVLKEVGVVDSGGAGLVLIIEGIKKALEGSPIARDESGASTEVKAASNMESDEFGYCTEFIIRLSDHGMKNFKEESLKQALARIGDSIVVVQDEEIVKVHVHTLQPGDALNLGQRYGEFAKLKIENMQEQHEEVLMATPAKAKPKQKYAIIAVAAGEGLGEMFKELRVDHIISGGQTMNPSTEDFVEAIKQLHAEHIFILPNNSNIVLAAQQAAMVMEDANVHVIPSKTIPQGLNACIMFNPEVDVDSNVAEMSDALTRIKTGQVTYAIKNTTFEGLEIHEQDYMAISEKDIIFANPSKMETTKHLLSTMIDEDCEIVTLIAGEDCNEVELEEIEQYIANNFEVELEVTRGDQPVYCFVIGVE